MPKVKLAKANAETNVIGHRYHKQLCNDARNDKMDGLQDLASDTLLAPIHFPVTIPEYGSSAHDHSEDSLTGHRLLQLPI